MTAVVKAIRRKSQSIWFALGERGRIVALMLCAMMLAGGILSLTRTGAYLNSYLFYNPLMRLRQAVGLGPRLHSDVFYVIADDPSIEAMGRTPTFAEWLQIADLFFAEGAGSALYVGVPDVRAEVGNLLPRTGKGRVYVGAVVDERQENPRVRALEAIPPALLPVIKDATYRDSIPLVTRALLPRDEVLAVVDGVGAINPGDDNRVDLVQRVADDRALMQLGILTAAGQLGREQTLSAEAARLNPDDGKIWIDFVNRESLRDRDMSVRFLFQDGKLRQTLTPKMRERIRGTKIVALIPNGFTGGRFVDTPYGLVPAYHITLSLLTNMQDGWFIHAPIAPWIVIALAAILALPLLQARRTKVALLGGLSLIVSMVCGAGVLLLAKGWYLPGATLGLVAGSMWAARLTVYSLSSWSKRLKLEGDLNLGRTVQSMLMPADAEGNVGPCAFKVVFKPFGPMSGDWFQHFVSENGQIGAVAIGDVVGKGPSAALITATIATVWLDACEAWARGAIDGESFVLSLHRAIERLFEGRQNSSLSFAIIRGAEVTVYCCGAPSWAHVDINGECVRLKTKAQNPLGAASRSERVVGSATRTLLPGETLIAYTDGVLDGTSSSYQLAKELKRGSMPTGPGYFDDLAAAAIRAGSASVLDDDQTIVMIRNVAVAEATATAPHVA